MIKKGYHSKNIKKASLGTFDKIKEEFLEAEDARKQNCAIMVLLELSDLIGAIEEYVKKYNLVIDDVIKMNQITKRAFKNGFRN